MSDRSNQQGKRSNRILSSRIPKISVDLATGYT